MGQSLWHLVGNKVFFRLNQNFALVSRLLLLAFFPMAGMDAEEPGFFLLPDPGDSSLVQALTAPVLDREYITNLASKHEDFARTQLQQRTARVRSSLCEISSDKDAFIKKRDEALTQAATEYNLYEHTIFYSRQKLANRLETSLDPALRETALKQRQIAYDLQLERQILVYKTWDRLLRLEDLCGEKGEKITRDLFKERLFLPYYIALHQYQTLFLPEKRQNSLFP